MKRKWLIAALLSLVLTSAFLMRANQSKRGDGILWGTKELTWDDFKGVPKRPTAATSLSMVEIELVHPSDDEAQAVVKALFYPDKSWVNYKDSILLQHERGHFDITELYARKLRKELANTQWKASSYKKMVMDLHHKIGVGLDAYQDLYDEETNSSTNLDKQKEWYENVHQELRKLDAYASVVVPLQVDWAK